VAHGTIIAELLKIIDCRITSQSVGLDLPYLSGGGW
jgi:hypothetical protein